MAWKIHPKTERFLDLLLSIDFPNRYYGFINNHTSNEPLLEDDKNKQEKILIDLGIKCRYFSSERFFRHEIKDPGGLIWNLHFVY